MFTSGSTMTKNKIFKRLGLLVPAVLRLGLINVATVALYRLALRGGVFEKYLPLGQNYTGDIFQTTLTLKKNRLELPSRNSVVKVAEELLEGKVTYFSNDKFKVGSPPAWFHNPLNSQNYGEPFRHWSRLDDFDSGIGDIKAIWELSRFDWALVFARAYRQSRDLRFLNTLNVWVSDWIKNNPLNTGPNWKCGQEASIRLLQFLLAAFLVDQYKTPSQSLIRFISEHCRRIEPTIRYAIAQNNNHGTSEAAALFIGGAWLENFCGNSDLKQKGARWKIKGRRWLENRLNKLVESDGSFSQNSINYHRLLVDTLNMVEFWRKTLVLNEFSSQFYSRCRATVSWLYGFVDEASGDAPNLGANDGARLFVLSNTDYRDFRPTVQLGAFLFLQGKVYSDGEWDEPLVWLELDQGQSTHLKYSKKTRLFPHGGYVAFTDRNDAWGILRYPRFRFRPGHADAFHFDLWHRGINVLRDSGSFSYNTIEPWKSYFSSVKAHNTIEMDGQEQMLPVSRFLRVTLLKMGVVDDVIHSKGKTSWSGTYQHYSGSRHRRTVIVDEKAWTIVDDIEGYRDSAVLRWRLAPGDWQISGAKCYGALGSLEISSDVTIRRFEIVEGWESKYYFQKNSIPVLEIEVGATKATLRSVIQLTP